MHPMTVLAFVLLGTVALVPISYLASPPTVAPAVAGSAQGDAVATPNHDTRQARPTTSFAMSPVVLLAEPGAAIALAEPQPATPSEPQHAALMRAERAAPADPLQHAALAEPAPVAAAEPQNVAAAEPQRIAAADPQHAALARTELAAPADPLQHAALAEPAPVAAAEPQNVAAAEPQPIAAPEPRHAALLRAELAAPADPLQHAALAEPAPVAPAEPQRDAAAEPQLAAAAPTAAQAAPQAKLEPAARPALSFVTADTALYAKDRARLRSAPSTAAIVLTRLDVDAPLHAIARSTDGAWWQVSLAGGRSGYIHRDAVTKYRMVKTEPAPSSRLIAVASPQPAPASRRAGLLGYVDKTMDWFADTAAMARRRR